MQVLLNDIFIGVPKTIGNNEAEDKMDQKWTSSIFKQSVSQPIWLGKTNLVGDQQADLVHHGGPEKAIFAYPVEHYSYWRKTISNITIYPGGMGENFSLTNQLETDVAIGDTYEIGEAVIQVSQPRQPCWKPARRFKQQEFALQIQRTGRTGWYFRVLQEGIVEKNQLLNLIDRPFPEWTIAKCNEVMHDSKNLKDSEELSACPSLAINWQRTLKNRVQKGIEPNLIKRIYGPNI